jgi:malate dehydrogenase
LILSLPVRVREGKWEIVQQLLITAFSREKINKSVAELKEEKSLVSDLQARDSPAGTRTNP